MLKEVKEGQAENLKPLTQHANTSQQVPVKHCGICSCNSNYTDECPQLQEDQTIAASHNFYDNQQSSPNNLQYYPQPQGWRDNQQNRWNPPQQPQQNQFRQPYTYNQPQNPQNQRYQPPHTRQTYPPPNVPPPNHEETLHAYQQESREVKENQKRLESQRSHITEGGINMVHNENDEEEDEEDDDEWLFGLLAELADSDDDSDDEEVEEEPEREVDDEEVEEETEGETFFIATIFRGNKVKETEMPVKCEYPGPCLVTSKIRGVDIPECLCDPGACGNVMRYALYETLDLGLLKKSKEVFTTVDSSIPTSVSEERCPSTLSRKGVEDYSPSIEEEEKEGPFELIKEERREEEEEARRSKKKASRKRRWFCNVQALTSFWEN
ncbi:hypothetical protein PIB30_061387 [Stylosanthes scabra]|uniref:Uncharacterized protein n=1 Tax=Stylosanthes scabra TaxID=79078 RepID=A0ABU6ZJJ0_9FABA|nr:hypothetical protein [Stylosanthes scabra]